jgi:hypothetical protein
MGWEKRGRNGERLVYYRKKRVGKRVFSVYIGPGEVGERAEREDRERRELAGKTAAAPSVPAEVLQGATQGATLQVVVGTPPAAEDSEAAWVNSYVPRTPSRRYRRSW